MRDATEGDWPAIRAFARPIVAAGETFAYDRDLDDERLRALWLVPPPGRTVVAVLGFEILATSPEAFHHPTHGYVGLHVMHRRL